MILKAIRSTSPGATTHSTRKGGFPISPRFETANSSPDRPLFGSYFLGGFECSTHKLVSGQRLDMIAATRHDQFAQLDYTRLKAHGIFAAREGVRWHLIEATPGHYDFSSVRSIAQAAQATNTQVIWDLCHFGWPDHVEIFKPEFITRLAEFAAAFAQFLADEMSLAPFFVPVNEISFFAWAGGEEGSLNPHATGRGFELKCQLVRAAIAAMNAIRAVNPLARFVHVDPVIHMMAHRDRPEDRAQAEACRLSQFQSWDMIAGRVAPELGGRESYLDIIGVNYYIHNQWIYDIQDGQRSHEFGPLSREDPDYRPFRDILREVYERYRRPMFIAETGAEDDERGPWLRYVVEETQAAVLSGIPVGGICLYPILNHPGWNDCRHCHNGLWDYADEEGNRVVYAPLAGEIYRAHEFVEKIGRNADFRLPKRAAGEGPQPIPAPR